MEIRVDGVEKVSSSLNYLEDYLYEGEKLEEIRQIAYDLYEKKGRTRGTELASWFEAAQILKSRGD